MMGSSDWWAEFEASGLEAAIKRQRYSDGEDTHGGKQRIAGVATMLSGSWLNAISKWWLSGWLIDDTNYLGGWPVFYGRLTLSEP